MTRSRSGYRVTWTETAARDLDYIALDSAEQARKTVKQIRRKTATLRQSPLLGGVVPELLDFGLKAWRELVLSPYRIIYRVEGKRVLVHAVIDGRRDVEAVLLERLLRP